MGKAVGQFFKKYGQNPVKETHPFCFITWTKRQKKLCDLDY